MEQKHEFKSIVAETLLIPLYMWARESHRDNPILNDKTAGRSADSLEYGYSKFGGAKLSEVGCAVQRRYFDYAVQQFIKTHPGPAIVNVGYGLDTRFRHIGNGKAILYDMDLPGVTSLRRELIYEQPGNIYIAASLLETDRMDDLLQKRPRSELIFIVEGVLMYSYGKQVEAFLHHVARRFGGGELWFDVYGIMMSRHGVKSDSLREHKAQARSGLDNGHVTEKWIPGLQLIEQVNYTRFFRLHWGLSLGYVLGRIPQLCFKSSPMLGYKII